MSPSPRRRRARLLRMYFIPWITLVANSCSVWILMCYFVFSVPWLSNLHLSQPATNHVSVLHRCLTNKLCSQLLQTQCCSSCPSPALGKLRVSQHSRTASTSHPLPHKSPGGDQRDDVVYALQPVCIRLFLVFVTLWLVCRIVDCIRHSIADSPASKRCDWYRDVTTLPLWSLRMRCRLEPPRMPCRASRSPPLMPWRSRLPRNKLPCLNL